METYGGSIKRRHVAVSKSITLRLLFFKLVEPRLQRGVGTSQRCSPSSLNMVFYLLCHSA
jgi:hypothetical protein